jgi:hypothetical protein
MIEVLKRFEDSSLEEEEDVDEDGLAEKLEGIDLGAFSYLP